MYNYPDLLIASLKKLNLKRKTPSRFLIERKIRLLLRKVFWCGGVILIDLWAYSL